MSESLLGIQKERIAQEANHIQQTVHGQYELEDYIAVEEKRVRKAQGTLSMYLYDSATLTVSSPIALKAGIGFAFNVLPDEQINELLRPRAIVDARKKILSGSVLQKNGRYTLNTNLLFEEFRDREPELYESAPYIIPDLTIDAARDFVIGVVHCIFPFIEREEAAN